MSKRISVQWRITILTALLIAAACVSLNLLLFYSGSDSMDALNGFVVEYKTGNQQEMTIEIPPREYAGVLQRLFSAGECRKGAFRAHRLVHHRAGDTAERRELFAAEHPQMGCRNSRCCALSRNSSSA